MHVGCLVLSPPRSVEHSMYTCINPRINTYAVLYLCALRPFGSIRGYSQSNNSHSVDEPTARGKLHNQKTWDESTTGTIQRFGTVWCGQRAMSSTGIVAGAILPDDATAPTSTDPTDGNLTYRMIQPPKPALWWNHHLYQGPDGKSVEVLYSKTKQQSETIAQLFLDEPVVGFDMEWPMFPKTERLQEKIGLIQVACEDKIALFHIGLHTGSCSDQLIAPSLRKLIESQHIAKTGVNIRGADFSRLSKHFGLKPRGAFELSHLYRLVNFSNDPKHLTTKLVGLATQVENQLKLPLSKGPVRTSNWSRPLSQQQIDYAAADAYAGFMLFHTMNCQRMALDPTPPLPIFAEQYYDESLGRAPIGTLRLHPIADDGEIIIAKEFFASKDDSAENQADDNAAAEETMVNDSTNSIRARKEKQTSKKKRLADPLDASAQQLFDKLKERRLALAKDNDIPAFVVANNDTLEDLARQRPQGYDELLEVKGIGPVKRRKYGAEWLEVIAQHSISDSLPVHTPNLVPNSLVTPRPTVQWQLPDLSDSSDSECAYGTPKALQPQLHTGLSFSFSDIEINDEKGTEVRTPSRTLHVQSTSSQRERKIRKTEAGSSQAPASARSHDSSPPSSSIYFTPPSRAGSKRPASSELPSTIQMVPTPNLENKIFRNKLQAYSRQIERKLTKRSPNARPIVSDGTLDMLVAMAPTTDEELLRVPGINEFREACLSTNNDLLQKVIKFRPAKS
ncbi:unnamed protein product [Periconia digitata]|uniref:HRDC domain-containing protein n=1 Tax=Periconia digitata TaxID=1303443 RepID=A0A9W4U672_9PLEO|nr:unnamed protein product [Periconia digitata]